MALYGLSDLHLAFGSNKPMDIFRGWENYIERLKANWTRLVKEQDTVVLAGDTSWALKLPDTGEDFRFLNSLAGKKIILKGNHDLWWQTRRKNQEFFDKNSFDTVSMLYNNSFLVGDIAVCGSRGWLYDGTGQQDEKIIARECGRLRLSLESRDKKARETIVFLHYPPAYGEYVCKPVFDLLKEYGVTKVYYGHIHGLGKYNTVNEYDGIKMRLISCDCVDFTPVFVG